MAFGRERRGLTLFAASDDHGSADARRDRGLLSDMATSGGRGRPGRSRDEAGPLPELLPSKLPRPLIRPETVHRSSLIEWLVRQDSHPIVSVVAPPGFGKTTLLAQWVEHSGQAVAWVSVDEKDNDPKVLLRYVAEALNAVQPVGERVFLALASPASSVPGQVVPTWR
jgi:hypothetical protein